MIDFKKLECRDVVEVSDCGVYTAGISFPFLIGNIEGTWIDQIECHADTKEEALALRAKIATALGKYATEDEQPSHQGDEMSQQPTSREALAAQAASVEPVGEVGSMPGTSGFTMACFKAEDVPVGTKLFASAPPSPANVPATDIDELREALRMGVACLRNWKILHPEDFDDLDERAVALLKAALATKETK